MSITPPEFAKRRRCLRFTLRGLALSLAIGCVALGWWVDAAQRQRRTVAFFQDLGFVIRYDYHQVGPQRFLPEAAQPPGAGWLRERLGRDFYCSVVFVNGHPASRTYFPDDALQRLADLPRVKVLALDGLRVGASDMKVIAGLSELESLSLYGAPIGDAELAHFTRLPRLKELDVRATNITEAGYQSLCKLMPQCEILWSPRRAEIREVSPHTEFESRCADRALTDDERSELREKIRTILDRNNDWLVREKAARVLGDLGHEDAIAPLAEVIFDREDSPQVRHACARAIRHIADPRSVEVLIDALTEDETEVWITAYASLFPLARGRLMGVDEWYTRDWTLERRQEAQQQWRRWWSDNKDQEAVHRHRPLTYSDPY